MKALEKNRDRRYQSVAALSEDVGHYLNEEPIAARGPTIGYLLQKTLSKHRTGVGLWIVLLGILLGSYVVINNLTHVASIQRHGASESDVRWTNIIAQQVQLDRLVRERTTPLQLQLPLKT